MPYWAKATTRVRLSLPHRQKVQKVETGSGGRQSEVCPLLLPDAFADPDSLSGDRVASGATTNGIVEVDTVRPHRVH